MNEFEVNFQKEYEKLNPKQKLAVDTIDGTVLVIAGPGSGKTQILTLRIANILQTASIDSENILCLTYTESGARTMKERLAKFIGEKESRKVNISTFHAFCMRLREEYGEYFEKKTLASDIEKVKILKNILEANDDLHWICNESNKLANIGDILRSISEYKRERNDLEYVKVQAEKLEDYFDTAKNTLEAEKAKGIKRGFTFNQTKVNEIERKSHKLSEFYKVAFEYDKKLQEKNLCDFDDLINDVVDKLKSTFEFSRSVQEKFQYILVDEFQDTNAAQNEIVSLLGEYWVEEGLSPNIFVVGDDDQSIYRFQGASVSNILEFQKTFPSVQIIVLDTNYRSSQEIVESARSLVAKNQITIDKLINGIDKNYLSFNGKSGNLPQFINFSNNHYEVAFITKYIQEYIKNAELSNEPKKYNDIAILFRRNYDAYEFIKAFDRKSIPYKLNSSENLLSAPIITKFLNILKVIADPYDQEAFFDLLSMQYLGINLVSVYKLNHEIKRQKGNDVNLLEYTISNEISDQIALLETDRSKIAEFSKIILELKSLSTSISSIHELMIEIANKTGFYSGILNSKIFPNTEELIYLNINKVNSFLEFVKKQTLQTKDYSFAELIKDIDMLKNAGFELKEEKLEISTNGVNLLTAHGSKGAEYDIVFIARAEDSAWTGKDTKFIRYFDEIESKFDKDEADELTMQEEERRLFYVAMTRAKKELIITNSKLSVSRDRKTEKDFTNFINDIDPSLIEIVNPENIEENLGDEVLGLNIDEKIKPDLHLEEKEYLTSLLKKQKISPTTLTKYLNCGYKFKLDNLVKVPQNSTFVFGNLIHGTLEKYFQIFQKTKSPGNFDQLIEIFQQKLVEFNLPTKEASRVEKKGTKLLSEFYNIYSPTFKIPVALELNISTSIDDIPIVGKIDKLEQFENDKIAIVDYKTGKSKNIEKSDPTTKNEHDYMIQLKFYQLLLELDGRFKDKIQNGYIDFVEPDAKTGKIGGRTKGHLFSKEQIDELTELIKTSVKNMFDMKFEKTKNVAMCRYCRHKNHCWPAGVPRY